ncbi:MAG TPA: hypothetical protein VFK38_01270 [Candidatus Limnocylindrales bacterium]|nr:hypothetical protein [Candidatus Limnocylindrales bacterium]
MSTDLTVVLVDRPGTLADAMEALGGAGINVDGACGFACGGEGIFHVLVEDAARGRQAVEAAGLEVRQERDVVVTPVEDRPGAGGAILRRIAAAGANVDLVYLTADGRLVLSGGDVEAIRRALG